MLIKEYRVINNSTEAEYQVAQLYAVAVASKNETGDGEGVEVLVNEPYEENGVKGQYTHKVYHLSSKVPAVIRVLAPSGSLEVHEKAWNAFPYCKTVLTNAYMQEKFSMTVETLHVDNDHGMLENALKMNPNDLKKREVIMVDVAHDPIDQKDYKREEDPKFYHSEKTDRGPLKGDWIKTCQPVMTCYKLVSIEFKWWGLQNRIENFIQQIMRGLFTKFHRQVFCWTDQWYGLTMEDIRKMEEQTKKDLDEQRNKIDQTNEEHKLTHKSSVQDLNGAKATAKHNGNGISLAVPVIDNSDRKSLY